MLWSSQRYDLFKVSCRSFTTRATNFIIQTKINSKDKFWNINSQLAPPCMEFITKSRSTRHNLRKENNLAIPFSNSYCIKNSIAYRGAVIWNLLSPLANGTGIKAFTKKAWQSSDLREMNFSAESPSTIQHMDTDFVYLWLDFVFIWDMDQVVERGSGNFEILNFFFFFFFEFCIFIFFFLARPHKLSSFNFHRG